MFSIKYTELIYVFSTKVRGLDSFYLFIWTIHLLAFPHARNSARSRLTTKKPTGHNRTSLAKIHFGIERFRSTFPWQITKTSTKPIKNPPECHRENNKRKSEARTRPRKFHRRNGRWKAVFEQVGHHCRRGGCARARQPFLLASRSFDQMTGRSLIRGPSAVDLLPAIIDFKYFWSFRFGAGVFAHLSVSFFLL